MALKYSLVSRNNGLTQRNTDIGVNAVIKLLTGARPTNVDTALSGNTTVATFAGNAAGFGDVASGVLTAKAIADVTAAANGTVTFARIYKADGTTAVADCDVGASGSDLNIAGGNVISSSQMVRIASLTITGTGA